MSTSQLASLLALVCVFVWSADALRGGAPTMACLNMRPLHGLHRPKPASASQFFLRQSSLTYEPGQNVTVEILTHSNERNFRGFMVQAYNPVNGLRIGKFLRTADSQPMPCSAATHLNHKDKHSALLTWVESEGMRDASSHAAALPSTLETAPAAVATFGNWLGMPANGGDDGSQTPGQQPNATDAAKPSRQVRFRGTIVVTYSEFYTEFESSERNFAKWDYSALSSLSE